MNALFSPGRGAGSLVIARVFSLFSYDELVHTWCIIDALCENDREKQGKKGGIYFIQSPTRSTRTNEIESFALLSSFTRITIQSSVRSDPPR